MVIDVRLIDADALKRKAQKEATTAWKMRLTAKVETVVNQFIDWLENAPTIEERKKGRWIYGEHDVAMCDGYWCDKCGFFVPWDYQHKFIDFIKDYYYCPSCGAIMKEGETDG